MPWLASPMSGFPLGTASAHRMGSGIVTQTLSPPEDLREGWTSPRTSQRCLKMESSLIGLKSDLVPHGSPLIGPRVQTTAAFAAWVSAVCEPRSRSPSRWAQRPVPLSAVFQRPCQLLDWIGHPPRQQHSETGWIRRGRGNGAAVPLISQPQGSLDLLVSLETCTSSPLSPFLFSVPSGIPEEARTWLCQLKSDLGSNRRWRHLDHRTRRAGDTFPTFLQLPARPEARVLEPSGISAASELPLSLPQHSGRGLKAAGLPHGASPNLEIKS